MQGSAPGLDTRLGVARGALRLLPLVHVLPEGYVYILLASLTIVYALTSVWTTLAFAVVVVTVKALRRASKQVDRIFEEEPG